MCQTKYIDAVKRALFIIFLPMITMGCMETIVMDPGEKDLPVVVNCILYFTPQEYGVSGSSRTPQSLTLFYAKGKSRSEFVPVEKASVYLEATVQKEKTGAGIPVTIPFHYKGDGKWETDGEIIIYFNTKYTLHVEIPGRDPIWAETQTLPEISPGFYLESENEIVREIQFENALSLQGCSLWAWGLEKTDQTQIDLLSWKDLAYIGTNHPYADGFNLCGKVLADLSFLGSPDDLQGTWEDEACLFYYDSFRRAQEIMPDLPLHDSCVRIGNLAYEQPFYIYPCPLEFPYTDHCAPASDCCRLLCCFATSDLDRYLRSVYIHNLSLSSYMTYVYSTSNDIYSNIHGGLGIFGNCLMDSGMYLNGGYMIY